MAKSADHASRPILAYSYRIRKIVREHALADRSHTSLWLAKTYVSYVIPAVMFGSKVWGTGIWQAGRGFLSSLSTLNFHYLKSTLGLKWFIRGYLRPKMVWFLHAPRVWAP